VSETPPEGLSKKELKAWKKLKEKQEKERRKLEQAKAQPESEMDPGPDVPPGAEPGQTPETEGDSTTEVDANLDVQPGGEPAADVAGEGEEVAAAEPSWAGVVELVKSEKKGKIKWQKGFCFIFEGVSEYEWHPRLEIHATKEKAARRQGAEPARTWNLWTGQHAVQASSSSQGPKKSVRILHCLFLCFCGQ
jgi:hypothetical protein